jgi:HAE1 family hydrophobic/amphiphilic exporter-1
LLASRFLGASERATSSRLARLAAWFGHAWDVGFLIVEHRYQRLLRWSLPRRPLVIGCGLLSFGVGLSLWYLGLIGTDFFPSGDQNQLDINITMPSATNLTVTDAAVRPLEQIVGSYPEIVSVFTVVGQPGSTRGGDTAQITALLVPPTQRTRSVQQIGGELRGKLTSALPAANIQVGYPNGFSGFGGQSVQVMILGNDPTGLDTVASQVQQVVQAVPGVANVQNRTTRTQAQLRAVIDWNRAADLGVTARDIGTALSAAVQGARSSTSQLVQPGQNAIDIRVLTANANLMTPDELASLPITSSNGGVIELRQVATITQVQQPTQIQRVNRLRSVTLGVAPAPGAPTGSLQTSIEHAIAAAQIPPEYVIAYGGQGSRGNVAIGEIMRALTFAILLMYMLLTMLFGSVVLPLSILMSIPLAVVGAFAGMVLTGTPITIFALLGFAVLLGLVGKNAILLVDYTEILRARGKDRATALLEAGPTRLRPIVMTTISVMVALLPIASGLEAGSDLLKPAAIVLIGGLLSSTVLTLVFVPAMYTLFDDLQHLVGRVWHRITIGTEALAVPRRPLSSER